MLEAQGKLDEAQEAYRASLALMERLAAQDPGNAGWQRDLAVSHIKVGDVLVAQGNLGEALEAYRASLALMERLAAQDPGNAGWQRDLVVSCWLLADLLEKENRKAEALPYWQRAHDTLASMRRAGMYVSNQDEAEVEELRLRLNAAR